jgi:hypothetical protein
MMIGDVAVEGQTFAEVTEEPGHLMCVHRNRLWVWLGVAAAGIAFIAAKFDGILGDTLISELAL